MLKNFILFIGIIVVSTTRGQVPIGQWQDHFPYHEAIDVARGGGKVYTATQFAVFSYDEVSGEVERLTKINALSDIDITDINYHPGLDLLVVAYGSGNLDLVKPTETVNLPFIKTNTNIVGDKSIYGVSFDGDFAYLSCGFGIVQVDLDREEIAETYIIGPGGSYMQINQTLVSNDSIYAVGEDGLYKASMANPNLLNNFNFWTKDLTLPDSVENGPLHQVDWFNNKLHIGYDASTYNGDILFVRENAGWIPAAGLVGFDILGIEHRGDTMLVAHNDNCQKFDTSYTVLENYFTYGTTYMSPKHTVFGSGGQIYVADGRMGLARMYDPFNTQLIAPTGPDVTGAFDMAESDGNLYVVAGGVTGSAWSQMFRSPSISSFSDGEWTRISESTVTELQGDSIFDAMSVAIDPEDPEHFFVGTFSYSGVLEFNGTNLETKYDENNSSLQDRGVAWPEWVGCAGMAFDEEGNLWVSNAYTSEPLSVLTAAGQWQSFSLGSTANGALIADVVIDDLGQKWVVIPGSGIAVFDDNGTPLNTNDDQVRTLTSTAGNGNLPTNDVESIAIDKDGEIWIGTSEGIAVIYTPGNVFSGGDFDAQQILIEQDGNIQILLETEAVTAIAVDGANRKWIGTESSGVFLMSENGTEEELRFNEDNSPLLSNRVTSIEIIGETGEVFFGTENGIISYRGTATDGDPYFTDVYTFPNPVKPDYFGPIAIKGLARDSDVKITDISGNLIYHTTSNGGQAIWDGNNFNGERAKTGVYLVFATDQNGEFSQVTKILIVN